MSDNELTVPEDGPTDVDEFASSLPEPTDLKVAADLGGGLGAFLPYLSIGQGLSLCCQPPLSWPQGSLALKQGTDLLNLGQEIEVFICDWRPKAMHSDKTRNIIKAIHDHNDPEFEEFKAKAEEPLPQGEPRTHYWGFEFLLYEGKTGKYMTLYCNNATLRRVAREKGFSYLHKKAIFSTKSISDKNRTWWGLVISPLSTPFDIPMNKEEAQEQIKNFKAATAVELPENSDDTTAIDAPAVDSEERPR